MVINKKFIYMRLLIVFHIPSQTVFGFSYLGKSAGSPYIKCKEKKLCIEDPKFSGLKELKTPSRFERLKLRYESGTIIIDLPGRVSDFTYSHINTPGPRDLVIEEERNKRFQ